MRVDIVDARRATRNVTLEDCGLELLRHASHDVRQVHYQASLMALRCSNRRGSGPRLNAESLGTYDSWRDFFRWCAANFSWKFASPCTSGLPLRCACASLSCWPGVKRYFCFGRSTVVGFSGGEFIELASCILNRVFGMHLFVAVDNVDGAVEEVFVFSCPGIKPHFLHRGNNVALSSGPPGIGANNVSLAASRDMRCDPFLFLTQHLQ